MLRRAFVLLAVLTGCGDDEKASPGDELQGLWLMEDPEYECFTGFRFSGDAIAVNYACFLEGGGYGLESYVGTFHVDGSRFSWEPELSSCDEAPGRETYVFEVSGSTLTLTSPDGVMVLERAAKDPSDTSTGEASFGCYDEEGFFDSHPLEEI